MSATDAATTSPPKSKFLMKRRATAPLPQLLLLLSLWLSLLVIGGHGAGANGDSIDGIQSGVVDYNKRDYNNRDYNNRYYNNDNANANNSSLSAAIAAAEAEDAASSSTRLRRGRRFLDFTRGARMSWRTNVKNNVIKVNTLWAHAYGFRFNYPFPDKADRRRPFFKRDVLQVLEESLDAHGLDGRACVLKSFCSGLLDADGHLGGGMLFKLMRRLFSLDPHELRRFPFLHMDNCRQILHSHCPLSFNSISPFTDDV